MEMAHSTAKASKATHATANTCGATRGLKLETALLFLYHLASIAALSSSNHAHVLLQLRHDIRVVTDPCERDGQTLLMRVIVAAPAVT